MKQNLSKNSCRKRLIVGVALLEFALFAGIEYEPAKVVMIAVSMLMFIAFLTKFSPLYYYMDKYLASKMEKKKTAYVGKY